MHVRAPNQSSVSRLEVVQLLGNLIDFLHPFLERRLCPKHRSIGLHNLLHLQTDRGGGGSPIGIAELVEVGDSFGPSILRERFMRSIGFQVILDVKSTGTTKDNNVEKGVG